jgi:geranylgeranyl diphosphate synthase, type II
MTVRLKSSVDQALVTFLERFPADGPAQARAHTEAGELYAPVHYLLGLGGKRLRPVLVLSAAEAEADRGARNLGLARAAATPAALAVELFHNFTLMHDDIMDEAPLRRGHSTVHEKWDSNAAILSGDAMFALAHLAIQDTPSEQLALVTGFFNRAALDVCIGQQHDMAFERRKNVSVAQYLEMIRLKTAVLVAASLAMGAAAAGAGADRAQAWYRFGELVGLAFQMQDDLLDSFGSAATGKRSGGDILSDKQTYLMIHCRQHGSLEDRAVLDRWSGQPEAELHDDKIAAVRAVMEATKAPEAARRQMSAYVDEARLVLASLGLSALHVTNLESLALHAITRTV